MKTEQEIKNVAMKFYDGIDKMVSGGGIAQIQEAWEHGERVTAGHPSGEWSEGWQEIFPVWELFQALGRPDRGGCSVRGMKVYVLGDDIAYTLCLFTSAPAFGGETLACTNILRRTGGVWKIIHHHADKAPKLGAAAERFAHEG